MRVSAHCCLSSIWDIPKIDWCGKDIKTILTTHRAPIFGSILPKGYCYSDAAFLPNFPPGISLSYINQSRRLMAYWIGIGQAQAGKEMREYANPDLTLKIRIIDFSGRLLFCLAHNFHNRGAIKLPF